MANDSVAVFEVRFPSSAIDRAFRYRIIVPKTVAGERLPVLYFLHGANSGPEQIVDRSRIVQFAADSRLIVVMPDGEFSYYTNAKHKGHARWEDAVVFELTRDVEARFPVLSGRDHTGIAGFSMGGYGAVKLALRHPDLYRFSGSLSGAFDITRRRASLPRWGQTWRIWTIFGLNPTARRDEDVFELLSRTQVPSRKDWFVSCGQGDPLFAVNRRFALELRTRGETVEWVTTGDGHDWQSWNEAMPKMFDLAEKVLR